MIWAAFGKGFVTMASLVIVIGLQNALLLRQGLKRTFVFMVATICFGCDVVLVSLGTVGLGALFAASRTLSLIIAFGGAAFLATYGVRSLLAAKSAKGLDLKSAVKSSRANIAAVALAVSLLNPHAIMDTVVIVGGLAARYQGEQRLMCAAGALTASWLWFFSLGYGARWLAPLLTKPKIWRFIDLVIGVMMLCLAIGFIHDGYRLF